MMPSFRARPAFMPGIGSTGEAVGNRISLQGVIGLRKRLGLILLGMVLLLGSPAGLVQAFQTVSNDTVYIDSGRVLNGPHLLAGQSVGFDGTTDGDLFVVARSARINGRVKGDLIMACQEAEVNGPVDGDIRILAGNVSLRSMVAGSFSGAVESLVIDREAVVGRDLVFAARRFDLYGVVDRDISATGNRIYVDGTVGRNVRLVQIGSLRLGENSRIQGNLYYSSPGKADIAGGAVIEGQQNWRKVVGEQQPYVPYLDILAGFLGMLLVWAVFRLFSPGFWDSLAREITGTPWRSLVLGVAAFFTLPVLSLVLLLTVVGIPLGMILGVSYVVVLYLSKIIVGSAAGEVIGQYSGWNRTMHPFWLYLLGLSLVILVSRIPAIGWLVSLIVVWWGMGAVSSQLFNRGPLG